MQKNIMMPTAAKENQDLNKKTIVAAGIIVIAGNDGNII
jgi:hypothetical protein